MKIRMTFEYDEHARRVVANHWGQRTPASREDMISWIGMVLDAEFDTIQTEYDDAKEDA